MSSSLLILAALALSGAPLEAQEEERTVAFPDYHLTLELPELEKMRSRPPDGQEKGSWSGTVGDAQVWISLTVMDAADYRYYEPGDVADLIVYNQRKHDELFRAEAVSFPTGKYGYAPFGAYFEGDTHSEEGGEVNGRYLALCGLLEKDGYVLEVHFRPAPSAEDLAPFREFLLQDVHYDGPEREPQWTKEEVEQRWLRDAPDDLHADFLKALKKKSTAKKCVTRTDHYIVLTNSSSGKLFAKQLEKNYAIIAKAFPFEEVEGRRLMPVFLFRTRDNYIDYCMKSGETREEAEESGGHAWKDYYTTWYAAPGDPVHIHECTHQIFGNRLRLDGGGSWFQEGVAEYIESSKNDRNEVARQVKKGQHTPLREFVQLRSLLHSSEDDIRGGSKAADHYKQAALFIEFLRESKFGQGKFESFLYTVGNLPRNSDLLDAAFQDIYGVSIDGLDEEWQKYCKKR